MAVPTVKLNTGYEMPALGFGTWNVSTGCSIYSKYFVLVQFHKTILETTMET